jgi:hypothetical protein
VGQAPGRQLLLEGDIGRPVQRPGASGLAEAARGLVEEALERVGLRLLKDRPRVFRAARLLAQAVRPFLLEGVDGLADGAGGATDPCGDRRRKLPPRTGQEDLGTTQCDRLAAAKSNLEYVALELAECSNE